MLRLGDFLRAIALAARFAIPGDSCRCVVALLVDASGPFGIEDGEVAANEISEYCGVEVPDEFGYGLLAGFDDDDVASEDLDLGPSWQNGYCLGQRLRQESVGL